MTTSVMRYLTPSRARESARIYFLVDRAREVWIPCCASSKPRIQGNSGIQRFLLLPMPCTVQFLHALIERELFEVCAQWESVEYFIFDSFYFQAPPLQPLSDQEVADGDGFPVCRRWMNVTHRINPASISVTDFRLRFDQIRTRQYDISQEPSQPASQPYTAHVGSSPDFMHHHQPFFGQSPMGQGSSSSMPFYPLPMPSQSPQIPQNVQSHQDEDDDNDDNDKPQQQPLTRPNRPRRRPTCETEDIDDCFIIFKMVFDSMGEKNVVTWGAMIGGCGMQRDGNGSLHLARQPATHLKRSTSRTTVSHHRA
ncbi:hypothetical protein DEO72_LG8g1066 [Vigna unguiculata]|uniref:Uncharacterized protein n=1 Tax=Vigna unguiculata TaxID=3917 RepID=A0A4D6MT10_VIGUN|nr:hypothetical protein DEO72_LG8g1066 [Vigna unguiculata]